MVEDGLTAASYSLFHLFSSPLLSYLVFSSFLSSTSLSPPLSSHLLLYFHLPYCSLLEYHILFLLHNFHPFLISIHSLILILCNILRDSLVFIPSCLIALQSRPPLKLPLPLHLVFLFLFLFLFLLLLLILFLILFLLLPLILLLLLLFLILFFPTFSSFFSFSVSSSSLTRALTLTHSHSLPFTLPLSLSPSLPY